ncbi:RNA binding and recognition [Rhizopogon vesiculosus]|uniref:RNA binding and recognition n=1 Tax=Rhizopogon vesiculosus TaxID=180088 RepID=A0A1J8QVA9_9AGAM|nr:RNA binding and recognition [Rhizopogon vesiculosus]
MPQHTQPRTWGTRFDTLLSSPSTQLGDADAIPQDSSLIANEACDDPKKSDRIVHDASIFIGSLPTNIEHSELARMLSDHLSDHLEAQTIKVVRDSKGGTCAFIQCQDAETAAILIANLHASAPNQFMGRYLRYEPARALRTLVVSYRAPRQFTPSMVDGNLVELDLPWAMKISRVPGARYLSVLYNSDARAAAEKEGLLPLDDHEADESGAYFYPLLFNAETLRNISTVFGGIEHFVPYEFESGDQEYPPPHDEPRSVGMDTGCWEIKWRHRDDCVSALITLRRVPHLAVTWAHHPVQQRQSMPYQPVHAIHNGHTQATSFMHVATSRFPLPNWVSSADSDALVSHHPSGDQTSSSVSLDGDSRNSNRASTALYDMTWSSPDVMLDKKCTSLKRPRALSLNHKPSSGLSEVSSSSADLNVQVNREETNGIDVGISPTPEFGTSPITPNTPGSFIPHTPTTGSYLGDFQSRSLPEFATGGIPQWNETRQGPFDPSTIFVGGLEMYGPNAWDEERVHNLFSRYGGIESVKVVRPVNKRSAFAFVKFNNKESSARAISHEHNRIIDGRPIRVQLRDWNPQHRGSWRHNRNRNLNPEVNIVSHESEPSLFSRDDLRVDPSLQRPSMIATLEDRLQELNIGKQAVAKAAPPDVEQSAEKPDVSSEPLQPSSSVTDGTPTVNFGDAVSPPIDPMIPWITDATPTSFTLSYPMASMAYYNSPAWATGFPPHPMQYMGSYPGYPLPPAISQSISPASSGDTHGTPSTTPAPGQFYAPFIPYHPYPARTPVRDQGQGQVPAETQAPLIPTGFIHGAHGMLIPLYPPDALDQYLSGAQGEQASTSTGTPPPSLPVQPPNAWRPYLPPAFTPGIPMSPGVQNPNTGPFPGPQGWMPNLGMNQHMQSPNIPLGPNGAPMYPMFEQRGGPSRRQFRRGNHSHFKSGGRGQPGRPARGSFAPNGAMMNTHSGAGSAHFTGSQQDMQNVS